MPYHSTANGKVLRAFDEPTPETEAVRRRGYATATDELEKGLSAVAAPIFGPDGRAVAALSDDLLAKNAAAGSPINLLRAEHRREHLDEIEHVVGRG